MATGTLRNLALGKLANEHHAIVLFPKATAVVASACGNIPQNT
jgi:hypothetical protein